MLEEVLDELEVVTRQEEEEEQTPSQLGALEGMLKGRVLAHYVAYNHRHLVALVIGHDYQEGERVADLFVLTNLLNVNGKKNFGEQFHQDVPYSESHEPGTWHWIEGVGEGQGICLALRNSPERV